MFVSGDGNKILQTVAGQGWRVLIKWAETPCDGWPDTTLEPVIAWVTARVPRKGDQQRAPYEQEVIAPLVRWPISGELYLLADLWSKERTYQGMVYLAPGEELSEDHVRQLQGGYITGVTLG